MSSHNSKPVGKPTSNLKYPGNNRHRQLLPIKWQNKYENFLSKKRLSELGVTASSEATEMVAKESKDDLEDICNDNEKEPKEEKEQSDGETVKDSVSSQGGAQAASRKVESTSKVANKPSRNGPAEVRSHSSRDRTDRKATDKKQIKASHSTPKKSAKVNGELAKGTAKNSSDRKSQGIKVHPKPLSESSEGSEEKSLEEVKDIDLMDEGPNSSQSVGSEDERVDVEENGLDEEQSQNFEEMESRIKKLEDELREIAALEVSLYSVVPEHGSSAHKVHTPARRLSRLYIHACKHWTQDKRASIARNTSSGLVLVAKSCGNDVPRLTFWLSNTVVLREILSEAFGSSLHSSVTTRMVEANGGTKRFEGKSSSYRWGGTGGSKHANPGIMQFVDDWQETRTFTAALEK
ncbi:hypothetical protein IFM89_006987 [Coptis chinensis]|uniref:Uncharacterized protein n=1 Tax=Coptis chinensis TaxID=261450 RepID=A0A835H992_9MAGN|nr:hypothetical protein IFM89_006987 [Coptis chinensis]